MAATGKPAAEPVAAGGRSGARSRRAHLLAGLAPVVLLCAAARAEADPSRTWVLDADSAEDVQVAMAPDGRAVVVWARYPLGRRPQVWARRFVPGVGFTPAVWVDGPPAAQSARHPRPRLALDAFGNGVVSWSSAVWTDDSYQDVVWATRLDWAEGWQQPEIIGRCRPDTCSIEAGPEVAVTPDGSALVVWATHDWSGPPGTVWASRFVAGHGWEPPQQIDQRSLERIDDVRVAAGRRGFLMGWNGDRVTAGWLDRDGNWREEKDQPDYPWCVHLALAMAERGPGLVAWRRMGGDDGYGVDWFDPEAGWQGAVTLFREPRYWGWAFNAVVDENGGAALASVGFNHRGAWVSRFVPGLGWQEPFELRPAGNFISIPVLAGNAAGDIVVVWNERHDALDWREAPGHLEKVWCSRFDGLAGWSSARLLASGWVEGYGQDRSVGAAMDEAGDALVAWTLDGRLEATLWSRPEP